MEVLGLVVVVVTSLDAPEVSYKNRNQYQQLNLMDKIYQNKYCYPQIFRKGAAIKGYKHKYIVLLT